MIKRKTIILFIGICVLCILNRYNLSENIANVSIFSAFVRKEPIEQKYVSNANPYISGIIAFRKQQYDTALELLQHPCLQGQLPSCAIYIHSLHMLGNNQETRLFLQIFVQRYTKSDINAFARYLIQNQLFDEVELLVQTTLDTSESLDLELILGQSYFYSNRFLEAEEIFSNIYKKTHSLDSAYMYGRVLRINGKFKEAILILERAVEDTLNSCVWYELGVAYLDTGYCNKARITLDKAMNLASEKDTTIINRIQVAQKRLAKKCIE